MNDIQKLLSLCKCGVYITVNGHRDNYETVESYLNNIEFGFNEKLDIEQSVREKMIKTNTVIEIQFYPSTPVGFHVVYHQNLKGALKYALSCFESNPERLPGGTTTIDTNQQPSSAAPVDRVVGQFPDEKETL